MTHSQWIAATQKPLATLNSIIAYFNEGGASRKRLIAAQLETIPYGPKAWELIEDAEEAFIEFHQIGVEMGINQDKVRIPIDNARQFLKGLTVNSLQK